MNTFQREVKERKALARQARYRRTHTGKGGCNLSSDRLTPKQWRERCGDVVVCNLNKPMTWENFKNLSAHTQAEYIKALVERFGANSTNMSDMFGVTALTIRRFLDANNLGVKFKVGHSMTKAQREAWNEFLYGKAAETKEEPEQPAQAEELQATSVEKEEPMSMCGFTLEFCGVIDPIAIANSIRSMMGGQKEAKVTVSCCL